MSEEEEYRKAKSYAWRRLARKNQPAIELRKHLKEREYSESIIDRVIQECRNSGYLDDQAWLEAFVKHEITRNQSPRAIAYKLLRKGIDKELTKETLERFCGEEIRMQSLRELIAKKKRLVNVKERAQKDKLIASLLRKGFNLSEIINIISEN